MTSIVLGRRNDWWATGKSSVDSAYKLARNELHTVISSLEARRIQIIIGPRRVGKSTLMQQAIGHLLRAGVEPRRILFFSCDDPTLFDGKTSIGDVIEGYLSDVLHGEVIYPTSSFAKNISIFVKSISSIAKTNGEEAVYEKNG